MEGMADNQFPSVDEALLEEIWDFIHPKDRHLFHGACSNLDELIPKDEFRIHLVNNEFKLSSDNRDYLYKRIEKLTGLNSSLDKFLTESNGQRYTSLIDSSSYFDLSKKLSKAVKNTLPDVRRWFDEYKVTTLYNYRKILRAHTRLNKLKNCVPFLHIYREMYYVREFLKMVDVPVVYRIVACSYGLQYAKNVSEKDARVVDTVFFNVLREHFSRTIGKLMTNIFIKNQYKYNPCDKLLMLMIFGQTTEESCNYVIGLLKDELVSVTSLTLQKYLMMESDGVGLKCVGLNKRNVAAQASLLPPDLSLLVVCKILSEFIALFQNLVSSLSYESRVIDSKHCTNFSTGSSTLDVLLNGLKKADYRLCYKKCLDLFVHKFALLAETSFDILWKLVSNFNLNSLKDKNDVLKISLLILYYITLQSSLNDSNGADKYDHDCKYISLDPELITILSEHCNKNFFFLKDMETSGQKTSLNNLENAVSTYMNHYSQSFTSECLENIAISLTNDTFERVVVNPVTFERFQMDLFCNIFKNYLASGKLMRFGNFKFPAANPLLGWTPNSNFVTINVLDRLLTDPMTNYSQSSSENRREVGVLALTRDYGGVYTLTSRMVLRAFEQYFKMVLVHPKDFLGIMKHYTRILDRYMYASIRSCKVDALVIQNLKRFNKVFGQQEMETYESISTCDTYRNERMEETSVSDPLRLSYVVNAVESCFTLLESLALVTHQNRHKDPDSARYLKQYYRERNEVVMELRVVLYHVVVYNVLRPALPSVALMKAVIEAKPLHIPTDVDRTFENFKRHLVALDGFLTSDRHTGFPLMVRLLLWDSIINVIRDSFKPLLNLFANDSNSELGRSMHKNYSETLEISIGIRARHVDQVQVDHESHRSVIANIRTYYKLVEELVESLK
ncbi:conserved hypothetical protein [Theileria orientalis strain Shintoku]|uniref:Uncharacterized protein n=1 Tax=Theileria orientalis strain Shintoku TaxID=869250 RepID=J7MGM2_THEOR|nr:conserved hypothetical protein [Theileria orientalis strain Shintoku]PVC50289.1 hypothetical protein MACL_00002359 [Theileria orientalis]BAM38601.1 conserved hypothetical protein [Theileria orientalis strain Shintoku]|eukprot:XP_009688902.1 conserved hypothetical protein [Theileria orientalis strain Shintoku]